MAYPARLLLQDIASGEDRYIALDKVATSYTVNGEERNAHQVCGKASAFDMQNLPQAAIRMIRFSTWENGVTSAWQGTQQRDGRVRPRNATLFTRLHGRSGDSPQLPKQVDLGPGGAGHLARPARSENRELSGPRANRLRARSDPP